MLIMDTYEINIVKDYESFKKLKDDWNKLAAFDSSLYPFMCHEWFDIWYKSFQLMDKMHIYVLRDSSGICAIMPLIKYYGFYNGVPGNIIKFSVNAHSHKFDIISDKKDLPVYTKNFMQKLINEKYLVIYFEDILESSETSLHIKDFLINNDLMYGMRYIRESIIMKFEKGWDLFSKTLTKKFKKNINNTWNKLNRAGDVRIVNYTMPEQLDTAFNCIRQISSNSWQGRNGTGMFSQENAASFYTGLAEYASRDGRLSIWVLFLNELPLAYEYHVTADSTDYALKAEFDNKFSHLSPGSAADAYIVKQLANSNVTKYDLLGYMDTYKTRWSNKAEKYVRFYIFNKNIPGSISYFIDFPLRAKLKSSQVVQGIRDFFLKLQNHKKQKMIKVIT